MKLHRSWLTQIALPTMLLMVTITSGCKSANRDRGYAAAEQEVDQSVTPESLQPTVTEGLASEQPAAEQNVSLVSTELAANSTVDKSISHATMPTKSEPTFPTLHTLKSGESITKMIDSAPGTVLVDFYATWCGPCKTQGKILHRVEDFAAQNQARIIKVDVDQHKSLAKQLDVSTLPTLVVIKDGKVVDRRVGLNQESEIRKMLR